MPGNEEKALSTHLKPLAPYLGKTYKGGFAGSTPENRSMTSRAGNEP